MALFYFHASLQLLSEGLLAGYVWAFAFICFPLQLWVIQDSWHFWVLLRHTVSHPGQQQRLLYTLVAFTDSSYVETRYLMPSSEERSKDFSCFICCSSWEPQRTPALAVFEGQVQFPTGSHPLSSQSAGPGGCQGSGGRRELSCGDPDVKNTALEFHICKGGTIQLICWAFWHKGYF